MDELPESETRAWEISPVLGSDSPSIPGSHLRVAVVHDYLTQRGGAERVVLSLMQAFPQARLITSVFNPDTTFPEFGQYAVETTWLDRIEAFQADPRRAMPLLPTVFSGVVLDDVDVVICSSSGWSHGVRTDVPKIVYCHNPPRWIYQRKSYVHELGLPVRISAWVLAPYLRWWDKRAAGSVDAYVANSQAVAGRILDNYNRPARILPPAVTIDPDAELEPIAGLEPGFLLTVSRSRGYKNVEAVCAAVQSLVDERLVVVGGLPDGEWPPSLMGVSDITDAQLRWLYAHCSAVVSASHEDFGLTPVEGYLFGKPAVCLRSGGFLDSMVENVTGVFFDELTSLAIAEAIESLRASSFSAEQIAAHGRNYGFEAFREALVAEAEFALAARGLDPLNPTFVKPAPRDNVRALRRPVSVGMAVAAVLMVAFVLFGSSVHPVGYVVAGGLSVVVMTLAKLRWSLRDMAGFIRHANPQPLRSPDSTAKSPIR